MGENSLSVIEGVEDVCEFVGELEGVEDHTDAKSHL